VVRYAEGATTQSKAWLDQNATKYNCRHVATKTGVHVLVGPQHPIKAIFNNQEARAAGLVERVSRSQAEAGDPGNARGREIAKLQTPNVSAQAVQATSTSPRDQHSPRAHSAAVDQAHSDSGAPKSGPPATSAKVYSYHANTMPGSNAFSGRARDLMLNFPSIVGSSPKPSDTISHADVFVDACECFSNDNDNATVDADVFVHACESFSNDNYHATVDADEFFDTYVSFEDNAEIEAPADDTIGDNARSSIRRSSPLLSIARRAARSAKVGLATLRNIATHELIGVLQPSIGDPKRSYVPRRKLQTCIMLLVMGMI
jgi:hypothetical protein